MKKTTLKQFTTQQGHKIYRLPIQAFPNHYTNCYLVLANNQVILIDSGSGWDQGNQELLTCFETLQTTHKEKVSLTDVTTLIITHGHIDHFGGVNFIKSHAPDVQVGIHELDARNVEAINERIIMSSKNLEIFLERAGLSPKRIKKLSEMNKWAKEMFESTTIHFTIDTETDIPLLGLFNVYHTPGHCPGQVCLQLDDILFSADHILARTTPVQSPESITRYTGLGHYLSALKTIKAQSTATLALGGHEQEIENIPQRIDDSIQFHQKRLSRVIEACQTPQTIQDISKILFPNKTNYDVLLALLETGAHVEYLYERGQLCITNLSEIEREYNPVILYKRLP